MSWKSENVWITEKTTTTSVTGLSSGQVTFQKRRQPLVPSDRNGSLVTMKPLWYRSQFSTLKVGSNIQRHAKVDSTVGTMKGSSIDARTMRLPRKLRFRSRASHIPSDSLKMVAQNV